MLGRSHSGCVAVAPVRDALSTSHLATAQKDIRALGAVSVFACSAVRKKRLAISEGETSNMQGKGTLGRNILFAVMCGLSERKHAVYLYLRTILRSHGSALAHYAINVPNMYKCMTSKFVI